MTGTRPAPCVEGEKETETRLDDLVDCLSADLSGCVCCCGGGGGISIICGFSRGIGAGGGL